jgi:glycosyltransferase involved in cell wall biosynthesis
MKILFDLSSMQPISVSGADFHGGGEYAKTVFYRLCELLPAGAILEIFYNPQRNIEKSVLEICETKGYAINPCRNNKEINKLLREKEYDVFYSALPYSYSGLVIPLKTRFMYTIHGLRSLEYPADEYELKYKKKTNLKEIIKHILFLFFPYRWKMNRIKKGINDLTRFFSITANQTIITISNHSKFSIAYFFPDIDISQIMVLYSPLKQYNTENKINSEIINTLSLEPSKYILLTGGDRTEKGAYRACKVLYRLMENHGAIPEKIKVLVLGVSNTKLYHKVTKNSRRFKFYDYVTADDLEILYKNAHLFLYPTLNEGFGYPPLEAMKYGTLCACSANSAITEIYGDSVLYFNPFDETEMSIRILQSFDEEIRKEKSQSMSVRCQQIREKQNKDLDILVRKIIS